MSHDEIDKMLNDFYKQNKAIISRDDPIMLVYTLNQTLLNQVGESLDEKYQNFRAELESLMIRLAQEKHERAEVMLNDVINYYKGFMDERLSDFEEKTTVKLTQSVDSILKDALATSKAAQKPAYLNLAASLIVFLSICLFAFVLFVFFR